MITLHGATIGVTYDNGFCYLCVHHSTGSFIAPKFSPHFDWVNDGSCGDLGAWDDDD